MKFSLKPTILAAFLLVNSVLWAQDKKDSLGLPGDNFDLYGALELFKQAKTPEDFEKAINSNDSEINNLDLDADGKVDYVKVIDKTKDESHSLVLQVAVSKTETQDVAVIEIEKTGSENAHVQIVGDEELYGKDYIIEPKNTEAKTSTANSAPKNNAASDDVYNTAPNSDNSNNNSDNNTNYNNNYSNNNPPVVINVWGWPSVQYMYGGGYVGWNSPYYYGYYPGWWSPWQPIYYPVYYRRAYRYHQPYFYRTSYYRCNNAHNYYYGQRSASVTVRQRTGNGYYRKQQEGYRNTGAPGKRYNSMPANGSRSRNGGDNRARENNVRVNPQNGGRSTEQRTNNRSGEVRNRETTATPRNQQSGSTPRQSGNVNRGSSSPRSTQEQPRRQNAQPQQSAPRQQQQSAPRQQESAPRQQQASPQRQQSQGAQPSRSSGGGSGGNQGGSRGNVGRQR